MSEESPKSTHPRYIRKTYSTWRMEPAPGVVLSDEDEARLLEAYQKALDRAMQPITRKNNDE